MIEVASSERGIINVGDPVAKVDVYIAVEDSKDLDGYLDKIKAIPHVNQATVKFVQHDAPSYGCTIATVTVKVKDLAHMVSVENKLYLLLQQ